MTNKLYASEVQAMLGWLDDTQRCYREGFPGVADNYLGLVRKYLLKAAIGDIEVDQIDLAEERAAAAAEDGP